MTPARHALWLTASLLFCAAAPTRAEEFTLTVSANQYPGKCLYVAIYREADGEWDAPPSKRQRHTLPPDEQFSLKLALAPGRYAMRAFVDLDGNGELDTRALGRPGEPFAISVGDGRSQPSIHFDRSVFTLNEQSPTARLEIRYPDGTRPDSE